MTVFTGVYTSEPNTPEREYCSVSTAHLIRPEDCCSAAQTLATQDISPLNTLHLLEQQRSSLCGEVKVKRILMQAL